jgi:glycosyltransferase involved in cell wall biosynthesis
MINNILFVQSHPIQYNAPFYVFAASNGLKFQVLYCSKEGVEESLDKQFGQIIKWDIPLLTGYSYEFLKNNSIKPSIHAGFFGLLNLGLVRKLKNTPPSLVIVPGWNYASYWISIIAAKFYGHKVALRGETPLNQEFAKKFVKKSIRYFILKHILFKLVDYFLYIGVENCKFYKSFGVNNSKLLFVPYCVDNFRFQEEYINYKELKGNLRVSLGIDSSKTVILFSGKYISKKRPLDLLAAFKTLPNSENIVLIMMGEGNLRNEMMDYINQNNLQERVILTGFINQIDIGKYYALADIFVMSSGIGETWGLSVNEALNFNLKLVVSDLTGCSKDLVINEHTGWIYKSGNIEDLAEKLTLAVNNHKVDQDFRKELLEKYSYRTGFENLKELINL